MLDVMDRSPAVRTAGEEPDVDALFTSLYADLCRLARREVRRNGAQELVGTGTLVHEAWLDIRRSSSLAFAGPGQFLSYAARMMRGLAIDRVRARQAHKRGGDVVITSLNTGHDDAQLPGDDLQAVREALDELEGVDPALALVVDLKFFCGFTLGEIATMQGVSERTVQRQWDKARGLLYRSLHGPA